MLPELLQLLPLHQMVGWDPMDRMLAGQSWLSALPLPLVISSSSSRGAIALDALDSRRQEGVSCRIFSVSDWDSASEIASCMLCAVRLLTLPVSSTIVRSGHFTAMSLVLYVALPNEVRCPCHLPWQPLLIPCSSSSNGTTDIVLGKFACTSWFCERGIALAWRVRGVDSEVIASPSSVVESHVEAL